MSRHKMSQERMGVCGTNECGKHRQVGPLDLCSSCGCILQIKTRLYSEECPLGYWKAKGKDDNGKCGGC